MKITCLGVDVAYQHCGIGRSVLTVIKRFFVSDNRTGCRFLTVDAYRAAIDFYQKNGFVQAVIPSEDTNKDSPTVPMYYDLKRVQL